jgi:hypothetical protein
MAFAKGQSGNPGGRGKEAKLFKDALTVAIKRAEGDKTMLAHIADALVAKAMMGDVPAINTIADRLDGKPHQTAEVTHFRARAAELSDDELAGYIEGGSGEGATETPCDPSQLN